MFQVRDWDGMSARTLDAVFHYGFSAHPSVPCDPSDFRRCYNWMILTFGSDKVRFMNFLLQVSRVHSMWKPFAEHWIDLERLYLEETVNETVFGDAPKLYKYMNILRDR